MPLILMVTLRAAERLQLNDTSVTSQKWCLIKHAKITHPNENLSLDKIGQPYESSENKQNLNAELKQSEKFGIQGIGRKKPGKRKEIAR